PSLKTASFLGLPLGRIGRFRGTSTTNGSSWIYFLGAIEGFSLDRVSIPSNDCIGKSQSCFSGRTLEG
ncbi:MAG TPA: hypothetical protein VH878_06650, partial [Thermodesulfobacteriota bacterium]